MKEQEKINTELDNIFYKAPVPKWKQRLQKIPKNLWTGIFLGSFSTLILMGMMHKPPKPQLILVPQISYIPSNIVNQTINPVLAGETARNFIKDVFTMDKTSAQFEINHMGVHFENTEAYNQFYNILTKEDYFKKLQSGHYVYVHPLSTIVMSNHLLKNGKLSALVEVNYEEVWDGVSSEKKTVHVLISQDNSTDRALKISYINLIPS